MAISVSKKAVNNQEIESMSHCFTGQKVWVRNGEQTQTIAGKDLEKQRNGLRSSQEIKLGIRKWVVVKVLPRAPGLSMR